MPNTNLYNLYLNAFRKLCEKNLTDNRVTSDKELTTLIKQTLTDERAQIFQEKIRNSLKIKGDSHPLKQFIQHAVKPPDMPLGILHLEGLIFEVELSDSKLAKILDDLSEENISVSFANCTFEEGYRFDQKAFPIAFYDCKHVPDDYYVSRYDLSDLIYTFDLTKRIILSGTITKAFDIDTKGSPAHFYRCFEEYTFDNVHIDGTLSLKNIKTSLKFHNISCTKQISLSNCPKAYFSDSNKPIADIKLLGENFSIVQFSNVTDLKHFNVQNICFDDSLIFEDCSIDEIDLSKASFGNALIFKNCNFGKVPKLWGVEKFPPHTSFSQCKFKDVHSEDANTNFKELRIKAQQAHDEYLAHMFHSYELESRYNSVLKDISYRHPEYGIEKIFSRGLRFINGYGRNLWWPFCLILLLTSISALLYIILNCWDLGITCMNAEDFKGSWIGDACSCSFYTSVAYSLQHAFGPVGWFISDAFIPQHWVSKGIEVFQVIMSSILWFLFITATRRRFRL